MNQKLKEFFQQEKQAVIIDENSMILTRHIEMPVEDVNLSSCISLKDAFLYNFSECVQIVRNHYRGIWMIKFMHYDALNSWRCWDTYALVGDENLLKFCIAFCNNVEFMYDEDGFFSTAGISKYFSGSYYECKSNDDCFYKETFVNQLNNLGWNSFNYMDEDDNVDCFIDN